MNPAQQNPKLIGKALSVMPPALKQFRPKNAAALVKEEQQVVLEHESLVVCTQQGEISLHGQLLRAVNSFLDICIAASKITTSEKSEYLDHLRHLHHYSTVDMLVDLLVLDHWSKDSFNIVSRECVQFVSHLSVLQTASTRREEGSTISAMTGGPEMLSVWRHRLFEGPTSQVGCRVPQLGPRGLKESEARPLPFQAGP